MREILFRGKRTDNGEWCEGYLSKSRDENKQLKLCIDHEEKGVMCSSIVIPETVGQYTGLTDKNGKKIFEGDIVKGTFLGFPVSIKDYVFSISWQEDITGYRANYFENVEVISNIHDNPELLKGGEHGDEKIY